MEYPQIDLYKFLTESELQHYYNAIKNELKITNATQFKYATDEDLKNIGLSRPEIRRLRKFYEKYFPHGYLSKIKRLLQAPTSIVKRDDGNSNSTQLANQSPEVQSTNKTVQSPSKAPNNKHIIPADSISVNKQLGTGEFGIVQQGVWTNGTERIQVAIKCLCRQRMQSNPMEFLKEAAIMHSIEHENIVRLYGVVLDTDSLMLVTELAHLRSLLECLKDSGLRVSFLTIPTLCEFAMQICNGMRYLENKRLIHRDLAARNILVFSKNKVKISDFGLSRALGVGKDYYKTNFNVNLKLPIAWCAPESINYLRFTNASDVWAYGVCLWEMFSYGFQPWPALTGMQILEAIDGPNYQRLEQPDCCPQEYYTLMMKCWQDDAMKRPKFSEIYEILPDMKPEQLKAVVNNCESKKDHLEYRQGDIITVLDRNTGTPFWKGVLISGKTGFFNPSNTVAYLEGLPTMNRDSFCRVSERSSKRKLRTEMISKPQNDLKHTGHVGIDGASFGDVAFLGNSQNYNHVPRQIVTPYKPSEDIEQTPLLLPPTPTSPDSLQTASGYFPEGANVTSSNPTFISSAENTPKNFSNTSQSSFEFPGQQLVLGPTVNVSTNPFASKNDDEVNMSAAYAMQNNQYSNDSKMFANEIEVLTSSQAGISGRPSSRSNSEDPHVYHEISDDEMVADKLDFGPSLLAEINSMFGSMSATSSQPKSPDFEHVNIKNEFTEISTKLVRKNSAGDANGNKFGIGSMKKKTAGTVKQISVKDEKILNQAIEIANEMSARSMIDLGADPAISAQSPKRKFSFRFPHLSNNGSNDKSNSNGSPNHAGGGVNNGLHTGISSPYSKKKNFTEELKSIPDLQAIIGEEGREAYNSLIERKTTLGIGGGFSPAASLLRQLDTNEFDLTAAKTLPRRSVHLRNDNENHIEHLRDEVPQLSIPLQNAPRPMTLPNRGSASRIKRTELCTTPKHNLSDRTCSGKENEHCNSMEYDVNGMLDKTSPCESPSYMTNTSYNFPDNAATTATKDENPIPLPPREGKKHIKTNPKRHVRKYPLIIPANGVQRTLNKVTEMANTSATDNQINGNDKQKITLEVVATIRGNPANSKSATRKKEATKNKEDLHIYQNLEKQMEDCTDSASLQFESILEADFDKGNVLLSPDVTDAFYNFSIQKEHYNKSKGVDYDSHNISGLYVNEDELRNLDIERNLKVSALHGLTNQATNNTPTDDVSELKKNQILGQVPVTDDLDVVDVATSLKKEKITKIPKEDTAENELAANALFKKVRESVNLATTNNNSNNNTNDKKAATTKTTPELQPPTDEEQLAATPTPQHLTGSNSVSCEDLLEFSNNKPKGSERGVDSDEVRIMMKVLGKDTTPTRCLESLESIDWDVHRAIKILRLQKILSTIQLSLGECAEALIKNEWDLRTTALNLKGH
ncbi:activated Cdc42 kinase-like isoform X2 [Teleopsis dalmanni]|uniref:activated Cdc42 kinase-like isoform X2 n=1 Tax=Teleopsis dalmanni TaxID=139649 RepID=UPI0018CD8573|nr:activated Cdc42 kinase-like isoform X2 [Teleopsis dalmanni]